mgnify:CR=1 FL=1
MLFDESFLMFYTKNIEVIQITNQYKIWIIIFPLVVSFGLVVYGNFTGAMETKYIKKSMLQALIVFLIFYFLATEIYQNHGLWLSFLAFSLSLKILFLSVSPSDTRDENTFNGLLSSSVRIKYPSSSI